MITITETLRLCRENELLFIALPFLRECGFHAHPLYERLCVLHLTGRRLASKGGKQQDL